MDDVSYFANNVFLLLKSKFPHSLRYKNYYVNKYLDFGIDIIHVSSFLTFKRFNTMICFLFQFTIFLCRPKYI